MEVQGAYLVADTGNSILRVTQSTSAKLHKSVVHETTMFTPVMSIRYIHHDP